MDDWLPILESIVTKIADAIAEMRSNGTIDKIYKALEKVLNDTGLGDLIAQLVLLQMEFKIKMWWISFKAKYNAIKPLILDSLKNLGLDIIGILAIVFLAIQTPVIKLQSWIIEKVLSIGSFIGQKMYDLGYYVGQRINEIIGFIKNIPEKAKTALSTLAEIITKPFKTAFEEIGKLADKFNPFEKLKAKTNISFDLSSLWSGPHATGGITNGPSIGMIGEDGREAVLPLDKNTGWMDGLATKIASKLGTNNSVNAPTINIDMSKANKEFYTRSEYIAGCQFIVDSLRTGGYKVQLS